MFVRQLLATALALVVSGVAIADDNSTSRFGGDGYAYFNQPMRGNAAVIAFPARHQPTGPSGAEPETGNVYAGSVPAASTSPRGRSIVRIG